MTKCEGDATGQVTRGPTGLVSFKADTAFKIRHIFDQRT